VAAGRIGEPLPPYWRVRRSVRRVRRLWSSWSVCGASCH
jgi:hypothetical protein